MEQKQQLLLFLAEWMRTAGTMPEPRVVSKEQIAEWLAMDEADMRRFSYTALDEHYARGYQAVPKDTSLTKAILPHLSVDPEDWP